MKLLSSVTALGAAMFIAVPAHGDTTTTNSATGADETFLAALRTAGVGYNNADRVVAAGKAVCGLLGGGEPGLEVLEDLKANNPGFTMDSATLFAAIAARSYCPQQVE
ncbi:DUF732 domain-containing protein [Mycobacterium intracellulare]|uniref:DUF732 domain-containing protein n=1 Tax=Mycobacterium intracellulare TaxID=1767 RepID=UPI001EED9711|nr:DUF732 domain-containing protein [Mycobacterium intracellulare]MEE3750854.1 DUF732 domain-containing protein [Mycobacterium intracellulare]